MSRSQILGGVSMEAHTTTNAAIYFENVVNVTISSGGTVGVSFYAEISGRLDFGRYYIPEDTIFCRYARGRGAAGDISLLIESFKAEGLTLVSNTGASRQWQCSGSGSILITSTVSDSDKLSFLQYIYIAPEYLYSFPPPPSPDYGLDESELRAGTSLDGEGEIAMRVEEGSLSICMVQARRCADPPY